MYELQICNREGEVLRRFDLRRLVRRGDSIVVGRSDDCDIRIESPVVSRRHCAIEQTEEGEWMLIDLGSRHGTLRDGEPVGTLELEPGAEVHVGPARLRFATRGSGVQPGRISGSASAPGSRGRRE